MLALVNRNLPQCFDGLFGAGLIVSGSGSGGSTIEGGAGLLIVGALLGALCGLLFGLITSQVIRYVSFLLGRHMVAYSWPIITMFLGAILFAWLALTGERR